MRILILNWRDPAHPLAGGAEISLLEHAKYWKRKGAEVTWVASSFRGVKKEETIEGIHYKRMGSHFSVHTLFLIRYLFGKISKRFDVVIDSFHFVPFFTPLYMEDNKIIALINEPAKETWFKNIFFPLNYIGYYLEPLFFIPYKKVQFITSANSIKEELVKLGIKKIEIIPHGINIIDPKGVNKEKEPTLIFLGTVSKDKGIEDALKAFIEVRRKIKDVRLWVVGKEEKKGHLNKLLTSYDLSPTSVTYFGFVEEKKKFELLKRAWVLVHPSIREGWGLNVIEANGVGTPAVGYNVTGLRDSIIDRKTGLLSDTDPKSMSDKVMELIQNKELYKSLSKSAKEWSRKFSWEHSVNSSWKVLMRGEK